MDYIQVLTDITSELVENKESLSIREMPSIEDEKIILHVYAESKDLSKLIGVKGSMANSIRKLMSVAGQQIGKRFEIKFESYE